MNTQTQQKTNKKEAAIASLLKTFSRKDIQPDTVYAVLKHVSARRHGNRRRSRRRSI